MADAKRISRRWRWGEEIATRMVLYENDELQAWAEAQHVRGIEYRTLPTNAVNITTFEHNVVDLANAHHSPSAPPAPPVAFATSPPVRPNSPVEKPKRAIDRAIDEMRIRHPRASRRIRFLVHINPRDSSEYQSIADDVFGDGQPSEATIRQAVGRVNQEMEEIECPVRFKCGSGRVVKVESPD